MQWSRDTLDGSHPGAWNPVRAASPMDRVFPNAPPWTTVTPELSRPADTTLRRVWTLAGFLLILLTVGISLWPSPPAAMHSHMDKIAHILGYNGLMLWFTQVVPARRWSQLCLGLLSLGVGIEILQGQTTYRTFSYLDIAANSIGIATGWLLASRGCATLLERIERRHRHSLRARS